MNDGPTLAAPIGALNLDRPTPPFATRRASTPSASSLQDRTSRPLSEISENGADDRRRASVRQSASNLESPVPGKKSRPNSEVMSIGSGTGVVGGGRSRPNSLVVSGGDEVPGVSTPTGNNKRFSMPATGMLTIPINLNDYAAAVSRSSSSQGQTSFAAAAGPKLERPVGLAIRTSSFAESRTDEVERSPARGPGSPVAEHSQARPSSPSAESSGQALLAAKRASLRPSPLGGVTYAEILNAGPPSPMESAAAQSVPMQAGPSTTMSPTLTAIDSVNSSVDSFHTAASSSKPPPKAKPSWLRRASGTAAFRKPKTPPPPESSTLPSALQPPRLPPRREGAAPVANQIEEEESPRSYASAAAFPGPVRSKLAEGQGRSAYTPMAPPPLPARDNIGGGIRNRLASLTAAHGGNAGAAPSQGMPRSSSSATLASTGQSALREVQQRLPSSAQRFMGNAGSAVQKGWMGLRSRGMGGSISNMSAFVQQQQQQQPEASGSRPSTIARKGSNSDRSFASVETAERSDGPFFGHGVVLRPGKALPGQVFGRDITEAGRAWGVVEAGTIMEGQSEWEARRRACLPAVMIRSVDYLEIWGPKEEGIFRISGRSSHISKLRKDFDSGADLNLTGIHPGDLDPHAVSGLFKSYIRELPTPLLTHELSPRFEMAARRGHVRSTSSSSRGSSVGGQDLADLLLQLPPAHWFALADIVKLLHLIPQHSATNRMTLDALKLSFGPSFNIPGVVLTELLEKREELFAVPPPLTATETAEDLINFGDIVLTPPNIPTVQFGDSGSEQSQSRSNTPASSVVAPDSFTPLQERPSRPTRLSSKQSLTRLFNGGGGGSASRTTSFETKRSSVVSLTPPRVDIAVSGGDRLPTFESEFGNIAPSGARPDTMQEKEEKLRDSKVFSAGDRAEEQQYQAGTVQARARAFSALSPTSATFAPTGAGSGSTSTPIADMFGTRTQLPSLRSSSPRESMTSITASLGHPPDSASSARSRHASGDWTTLTPPGSATFAPTANPASVVRRGASSFFQSGGGAERHGRSQSVNLTSLIANASTTGQASSTAPEGGAAPREVAAGRAD